MPVQPPGPDVPIKPPPENCPPDTKRAEVNVVPPKAEDLLSELPLR